MKIPKISKFWNCSSIRYSAPFAISPIFKLPFDISFIFDCSNSRQFGRSTFARSLIFKFEISAILKIYCSKFWPSPALSTDNCNEKNFFNSRARTFYFSFYFSAFYHWHWYSISPWDIADTLNPCLYQ